MTRVLVAGVGNVFRSDDGFGVEVVAALARRDVPEGVRVVDYGIRSLHLVYDLLEGYDVLVLVDTVAQQDGPPGSLYVIEPDLPALASDAVSIDPHDLPPGGALPLLRSLGSPVRRVLVIGCQPASLDDGIGLSRVVAGRVEEAADLVLQTVHAELAAQRS